MELIIIGCDCSFSREPSGGCTFLLQWLQSPLKSEVLLYFESLECKLLSVKFTVNTKLRTLIQNLPAHLNKSNVHCIMVLSFDLFIYSKQSLSTRRVKCFFEWANLQLLLSCTVYFWKEWMKIAYYPAMGKLQNFFCHLHCYSTFWNNLNLFLTNNIDFLW